jgi:hypothetical protein
MLIAAAGTASAQSQAQIASQLNEEGKELMFGNKYAEASAKFREAVARVPEPKYFFNLCTSLFQEGKFDEAITACNAVDKNTPSAELHAKTEKLVGRIQEEAKSQNIELHPGGLGGGGGDPNTNLPDPNGNPNPNPTNPNPNPNPTNPNPNGQPQQVYHPAVGRPPSQGVFTNVTPDHHYTWTLGADLFTGGGRIGQQDVYGTVAAGIRIKSDIMLMPRNRVGAEAWIALTRVGNGNMMLANPVTALDIFDVGVGLYKHICLRGYERVCLTPMLGVQLALMSPGQETDTNGNQLFNYAAFGARGEVALSYALGPRFEHVISAAIGFNAYSGVTSSSSDSGLTAADVGLDTGGAFGYLGIGYTYRFNTPLGARAFITLE